MALNVEFRHGPRELRSLQEWEQRLFIPARTLLHHASQGKLTLFVRPPFMAAVEYALFRVDEAAGPLTQEPFFRLPKGELVGFVPEPATLSELISGQPVEVESFDTVICNNLSWDRIRGLIPSTFGHKLQPVGWRAGAFQIDDSVQTLDAATEPDASPAHIALRSFTIRPDHVYSRDVDVQAFLKSMQSYSFISDLHDDGAFAEELPPYVSDKLKEVFGANRALWRKHEGLSADDRERKRAATREYLNEDFRSLCKKGTKADSLVEIAAGACDPTMPGSNVPGSSATRVMLALITAAKLLWSPSYIESKTPWTHPTRDEVTKFLQFMGMTATNMASHGVTLIRPEYATGNETSERPPLFRPLFLRPRRRPLIGQT